MIFQLFVKCVSGLRKQYETGLSRTIPLVSEYPFQTYLEVVFSDDYADGYDPNEMKVDNGNMSVCDVDTQREREKKATDHIEFASTHFDKKAVEYRIWVIILQEGLNLGKEFYDTLVENQNFFEDMVITKKKVPYSKGNANSNDTLGVKNSLWQKVQPDEKWKLIHSVDNYAMKCDLISGGRIYYSNPRMNHVLSRACPIWKNDNALHPSNIYGLVNCFQRASIDCCDEQKDLQNYWDGERRRFKLPFPDCALRIDFQKDFCVPTLMRKYLPDYQLRELEKDIDYEQFQSTRAMHQDDVFASDYDDDDEDVYHPKTLDNPSIQLEERDKTLAAIHKQLGGNVWVPTRNVNKAPKMNANSLARNPYEDRDMFIDQVLNPIGRSGGRRPTSLHDLYDKKVNFFKVFNNKKEERTWKHREYSNYRKQAFRQYIMRCCDAKSNISGPGKAIAAWWNQRVLRGDTVISRYRPLIDKEMTVFGSFVARRMQMYESLVFVSTSHSTLFLLNMARLDAYRHEFNLHLNVIMCGDAATSKSYALDEVENMSIRPTITKLTDETARARASDTHNNDEIVFFHEMPNGFLRTPKNDQDSKEAQFKERLTSGLVTLKAFHEMDNGIRESRVVKSENIGVVLGNTNDTKSIASEAIATRFVWITCSKKVRKNRRVQDLSKASKDLSDENLRHREQVYEDHKIEQFLHYHIEKFIMIGVLRDVSMTAFNTLIRVIRECLEDKFNLTIETRVTHQMRLLARKLSISLAIERMFHGNPDNPDNPSNKYVGKPFELKHLLDIDVHLHDTEEIAMFVVELMRNQFTDTDSDKVLRAIKEIYIDTCSSSKSLFRSEKTFCEDRQKKLEKANSNSKNSRMIGTKSPDNRSKKGTTLYDNEMTAKELKEAILNPAVPEEKIDQYYCIPDKRYFIKRKVLLHMDEKSTKLNDAQVTAILKDLFTKKICSVSYTRNKDAKLGFTEPIPTTTEEKHVGALDGKSRLCSYFHVALFKPFFNDNNPAEILDSNKVVIAIKECYNQFTLPNKYICGSVLDDVKRPNLFNTRFTAMAPKKTLSWPNLSTTSDKEGVLVEQDYQILNNNVSSSTTTTTTTTTTTKKRKRESMYVVVDMTVNEYVIRKRLEFLYLEANELSVAMYNADDLDLLAQSQYVHERSLDYPNDLNNDAKSTRKVFTDSVKNMSIETMKNTPDVLISKGKSLKTIEDLEKRGATISEFQKEQVKIRQERLDKIKKLQQQYQSEEIQQAVQGQRHPSSSLSSSSSTSTSNNNNIIYENAYNKDLEAKRVAFQISQEKHASIRRKRKQLKLIRDAQIQ